MKKLFFIISLIIFSNGSLAKEVVTIYWGWGAADSLANISRTLAHEANQIQNKYTFVFDVKPGAGGSVAADFIKRTPNTILATSSAFFVRPNLYPTTTNYQINEFVELMPQCYSPISITSSKYHSWQEVPKNITLFIGNAGLGSTTHLTSIQLKSNYNNLTFVPYKGVAESFTAMVVGDGLVTTTTTITTKLLTSIQKVLLQGVEEEDMMMNLMVHLSVTFVVYYYISNHY